MRSSIPEYSFKKILIEPKRKYVYITLDDSRFQIEKNRFSMTLNFDVITSEAQMKGRIHESS